MFVHADALIAPRLMEMTELPLLECGRSALRSIGFDVLISCDMSG